MAETAYLPVDLKSLVNETTLSFDLYYYNKPTDRYILYRSKDRPFLERHRQSITSKKMRLFIQKTDNHMYMDYLQQNIQSVIDDPAIDIMTKTRFYYNNSQKILEAAFDQPDEENLNKTAHDLTESSIKLIFDDQTRIRDVLSIMSFDYSTYTHSVNVSLLTLTLAKTTGYPEEKLRDFTSGALFHDIGKSKIPSEILLKPGQLTDAEWVEMKKHTLYGEDILRGISSTTPLMIDITRHHHEKLDGKGYPDGLTGNEISREAQLVSICDVFDALTTKRCYKNAVGSFPALKIMFDEMKGSFDKDLLTLFTRNLSR